MGGNVFTLLSILIATAKAQADDCPIVGVQCSSNCETVIYCTAVGSKPVTVTDCTATGTYCEMKGTIATCTATESTCNVPPGLNFKCLEAGEFPDVFNSSITWICSADDVNNGPATTQCSCQEGEVTDLTTLRCAKGNARPPVSCEIGGNMKKLEDTRFCYFCPDSETISVINCPDSIGTPIFPSTRGKICDVYQPGTSTSATGSSTDPTESSTNPTAAMECSRRGQVMPDPADCHGFFECNNMLVAVHKNCPVDTYFHVDVLSCVKGECV